MDWTPKQELERILRECGYSMQYSCESGTCAVRWKCVLCHDSWVTNDLYQAILLPTGEGFTQEDALILTIRKMKFGPHLDAIRRFERLGSLYPLEEVQCHRSR